MELSKTRSVLNNEEEKKKAIVTAFESYFKGLHGYAFVILRDQILAEEMVQEVFLHIWAKRERLEIHSSLKAYLYKCVYNECMDHLSHQKERIVKPLEQEHQESGRDETTIAASHKELETHLHRAIIELPKQCRIIFQMSRYEDLKYKEIADQLNISVKTVEAQIGKALKILRKKLSGFLS